MNYMIVQTYKSMVNGCLMESCTTNLKQMYCATLSLFPILFQYSYCHQVLVWVFFLEIALLRIILRSFFLSSISNTHMSLNYNFCIRIFILYKIYNIHHHPLKYKKIIYYVLKMMQVCIKLELMDLKVVYTWNGKPFKS